MSYLIGLHTEHLKARGASPHTIAKREAVLQSLHDTLPYGLAYAATEQIEAWMANPGWSRWTRSTYDNHIRMFYRWATRAGHLDGDPLGGTDRPKRPRCVPNPAADSEVAVILDAPEPLGTIGVLAAYEGMRAGEIARARREHISEENTLIPIGKGGDPGIVPTHPLVWERLRNRPRGPLIVDRRGNAVDGHWISQTVRRRLDRLGLDDLHTHMLRHWFGTEIQRAQGNIRVTQECLRHASVASTEIYTKVISAQREVAIRSLPTVQQKTAGPAS